LGLIGVLTEFPQGAPLTKQIPALVEFHLDLLQALVLVLRKLLLLEQLVLLLHELLDVLLHRSIRITLSHLTSPCRIRRVSSAFLVRSRQIGSLRAPVPRAACV